MHISLNWLKDYTKIELDAERVGEILTDIGLEVEGMETVQSIKGGLEGVVVGHVTSRHKHPNADKLSVTTVDVGLEQDLRIVCGAPNVAQGQKVLVATIGTTLYDEEEKPWTIKKGKIRGEVSEGMICAEDELGLGNSHEGIMVLPDEVEVGTSASEYFDVETDYVYEIGLTPNRSDATNHLGTARDLAAALKINYGHDGVVNLPAVDGFEVISRDLPVEVVVENTEACPRYVGVTIKDIEIKESPEWLKRRLRAVGVRPINNIVDITNFVLHETGQPLHAFDLKEIKDKKIVVTTLPEGSTFTTLDEVERKLTAEDLMICDGHLNGMCIAGVFGGVKSGVKDDTSEIFLESAHFNAKWIRRSSMHHNLRTDAAKVFEKGSDPNVALYALKRACLLIAELAGGKVSSEVVDIYPEPVEPLQIEVRYQRVNTLIGVSISAIEIRRILEAMNMEMVRESESSFVVSVPTNKSDVTREVDVIEEILRIYGFNKVPVSDKLSTSITVSPDPDPGEIRNLVSNFLSGNGFFEMMAVSLTESRYYKPEGLRPIAEDELVFINNTSNIHLDVMRPDMVFSGLEAIIRNQNRQNPDLKIYEFGKSYRQEKSGKINEDSHLTLFLSGARSRENWLQRGNHKADFYSIKAFVRRVLDLLGVYNYQTSDLEQGLFSYGLQFHRGPQHLVEFGKLSSRLTKGMDIREDVFFADFNWDNVFKALKNYKIIVEELNKFPSIRRDLALVVENSVKFQDIVAIARKIGKKLLKDVHLFDVYRSEEKLGTGRKSYAVSFHFEDPKKTLKDKDIDKVMNKLITEYEAKLGAEIRR